MNLQELKTLIDEAIESGVSPTIPVTLLVNGMRDGSEIEDIAELGIAALINTPSYQKDTYPKLAPSFEKGDVFLLMPVSETIESPHVDIKCTFYNPNW